MLNLPNFNWLGPTRPTPSDYSIAGIGPNDNFINDKSYSGIPWAPYIPSQALVGIPNWFLGLPSNLPLDPQTGMPSVATGALSGIGNPVAKGQQPVQGWFTNQYAAPRIPLTEGGSPEQLAMANLAQLFPVQQVSGMDLISNPNYQFWSAGLPYQQDMGAGLDPYYSITRNPYTMSGQFLRNQNRAATQGLGSGYVLPALQGYMENLGFNWESYVNAVRNAAAVGKMTTQFRAKRE